MPNRVLVTGAGGFIGHHLVRYLKSSGSWVRGADVKPPDFEATIADEFATVDLRDFDACVAVTEGVSHIYHLAADMGGIGYISSNHASIAANNTTLDLNMLRAAHKSQAERLFYASSACVYPMYRQDDPDIQPLREEDAYPADSEEGYGWEKLYAEKLCSYFREDGLVDTRIARFHNVYGPLGTFEGGREKAPAAICRKVALATDGDEIEVWGDGRQTRSFIYVDDCVEGIVRLLSSDYCEPLNLGTEELVTIDDLVDFVAAIAGKEIFKRHNLSGPQGVRGRNSDNSRLRQVLNWEPSVKLRDGLAATYSWIGEQLRESGGDPVPLTKDLTVSVKPIVP